MPVLLQTMNRQHSTLPRHQDGSGPARGPRYEDKAVLPSRIVGAGCNLCWYAPCTVWHSNAYVLDLSKVTFQHLVKLELYEPSVSFNIASLSRHGIYNTGNM